MARRQIGVLYDFDYGKLFFADEKGKVCVFSLPPEIHTYIVDLLTVMNEVAVLRDELGRVLSAEEN